MFLFFLGACIDGRVEKNIQNKIWAQIFFSDLDVYMTEDFDYYYYYFKTNFELLSILF